MSTSTNYAKYSGLGGSSGGGGVTTIGTIDSQAPSSNGAVISTVDLYMQSASSSNPGLVNNSAQTFSGLKTFSSDLISPIVIGSASASGTLTLESTSNATKGKVLFGVAGLSAYDEVNNRFGIGTASPNRCLTINDPSGNVYLDFQQNGTSQYLFGSDSTATFVMFNLLLSQYGLLQDSTGHWGMGRVAPTPSAWLTLQAGAATAGEAPLKITPGTNLTSAESGAIENDGTNLFYTDSNDVRWSLVPQNNVSGAVISVNSSGGAPSNYLQISDPNAGDVWDIDGTGQLSWQAAGGALSPTYVLEMNGGQIHAGGGIDLDTSKLHNVGGVEYATTTQTVANGDTLSGNGLEILSSAGAVSTSTSTVINGSQPSGATVMFVNVGSFNITLKAGGNLETPGLTDFILTPNSSLSAVFIGSTWYTTASSIN